MSARTSADRYARSLLDVAVADSSAEEAGRGLAEFAGVLAAHKDLRRAFQNPAVPVAAKVGLAEAVVEKLGAGILVNRLLRMLVERNRFALLPDILSRYQERLLAHQRVVHAEITTSEPVTPEQLAALEQRVSTLTGQRVTMSAGTDPSIIGGLVARIGSTVYDGSIATQLRKMRAQLAAER